MASAAPEGSLSLHAHACKLAEPGRVLVQRALPRHLARRQFYLAARASCRHRSIHQALGRQRGSLPVDEGRGTTRHPKIIYHSFTNVSTSVGRGKMLAMARPVENLYEEASHLPPDDRAELAGLLLESIDEEPDEHVEDAWAAEIERRMADYRA